MYVVKVSSKGQVTIPISIMIAWGIYSDDKLNVTLVDDVVVTLAPVNRLKPKKSIISYAGIASRIWEGSADDIDNFISNERES